MKKTIISLLALCSPLFAENPANSVLDYDLLFVWHGKDKAVNLSPEQQEITRGKDGIVTAQFLQTAGSDIRSEHASYLGVRRAGQGSQDAAYSCAGGLKGELVFNRANPGTNVGSTYIEGDYDLLVAPQGAERMITLNEIADALDANRKVSITLLRTPAVEYYDVMAVSVYDPSTETFSDYAVGMKIAGSSDTGTFDQANFYKQRFAEGYLLIGQDFTVNDAIDAGHSAILGRLVPEPATASLSLLALAGLAARRKRR